MLFFKCFFGGLFLQWLGVTRANDHSVAAIIGFGAVLTVQYEFPMGGVVSCAAPSKSPHVCGQ